MIRDDPLYTGKCAICGKWIIPTYGPNSTSAKLHEVIACGYITEDLYICEDCEKSSK